jgi:hypothetical protein
VGELRPGVSAPTAELLSWLALRPRTYDEAIDAWGSHCPRLTVWEDALIGRLIRIERNGGSGSTVALTAAGRTALDGPVAARL